jgi:solute carrier family 25 folate transporter 32
MLTAHLAGGVVAGMMTSILLHPLDVLKVRLQVDSSSTALARGGILLKTAMMLWKEEGIRGFYRGAIPGLLGSGSSWGLYFLFYEGCKLRLQNDGISTKRSKLSTEVDDNSNKTSHPSPKITLTTAQHMYAAWEAGSITCIFTNPLWLIKTRMQLQKDNGIVRQGGSTAIHAKEVPYHGLLDAFRSIVRDEGIGGLYRGIIPALLLTSHGMVQFGVYEALKQRFPTSGSDGVGFGGGSADQALRFFLFGAVSKAVATSATYPYQVIKSRLQQRLVNGAPLYEGFFNCVQLIAKNEGLGGFYKGFVANLLRVAPQSAITLLIYETVKNFVNDKLN